MQKNKDNKMLIFLDVETTGLEADDKICAIGIIGILGDKITSIYELINEGKKISSKASSINHITNEMIKDRPAFKKSPAWEFLQRYNNKDSTIIAHNASFDMNMLLANNFIWQGNIIDTLRTSRHLIPECGEFSLQFLRYELKLYKKEKLAAQKYIKNEKNIELVPHNALSDALNVKMLYDCLLELGSHDELVELSSKNILIEKFDFGKYNGRYIEEISMYDRGYLEWVLLNIADMNEDLKYTIESYLSSDLNI